MHAKSLQSCPNLCDPLDCSPSASSICGDSPSQNASLRWLQMTFPKSGKELVLSWHSFYNQATSTGVLVSARHGAESYKQGHPSFFSVPLTSPFFSPFLLSWPSNSNSQYLLNRGVLTMCWTSTHIIFLSPKCINAYCHFCHHHHHRGGAYQLSQSGGRVQIWTQVVWYDAYALTSLYIFPPIDLNFVQHAESWEKQSTLIIQEDIIGWLKAAGFIVIS